MIHWKALFVAFVVVFGTLHWLLTRPIHQEPAAPLLAVQAAPAAVSPSSATSMDRSPASKQEVLRGMAQYIEDTQGAQRTQEVQRAPVEESRATEVFGFSLNQKFKQLLKTESGLTEFQARLGNGVAVAALEVDQAFNRRIYRDRDEKLVLLDMTDALLKTAPDEVATQRLVTETRAHLAPDENQDLDYAGRSLQYYLDHEKDPAKKIEILKSLGVASSGY